jgi:hypothetical protein
MFCPACEGSTDPRGQCGRNADICNNHESAADEHRGDAAVFRYFGRTMELTTRTFRAELHDVVADDEHSVISLHLATGERGDERLRIERSCVSPRRKSR